MSSDSSGRGGRGEASPQGGTAARLQVRGQHWQVRCLQAEAASEPLGTLHTRGGQSRCRACKPGTQVCHPAAHSDTHRCPSPGAQEGFARWQGTAASCVWGRNLLTPSPTLH